MQLFVQLDRITVEVHVPCPPSIDRSAVENTPQPAIGVLNIISETGAIYVLSGQFRELGLPRTTQPGQHGLQVRFFRPHCLALALLLSRGQRPTT